MALDSKMRYLMAPAASLQQLFSSLAISAGRQMMANSRIHLRQATLFEFSCRISKGQWYVTLENVALLPVAIGLCCSVYRQRILSLGLSIIWFFSQVRICFMKSLFCSHSLVWFNIAYKCFLSASLFLGEEEWIFLILVSLFETFKNYILLILCLCMCACVCMHLLQYDVVVRGQLAWVDSLFPPHGSCGLNLVLSGLVEVSAPLSHLARS